MSNHMQPIAKLTDYFGDGNPIIVQEFTPGQGLEAHLVAQARELLPADQPNRIADFSTRELLWLS